MTKRKRKLLSVSLLFVMLFFGAVVTIPALAQHVVDPFAMNRGRQWVDQTTGAVYQGVGNPPGLQQKDTSQGIQYSAYRVGKSAVQQTPTPPALNWFGNIIVGFVTSFFTAITSILSAGGVTIQKVVLGHLLNPNYVITPSGGASYAKMPFGAYDFSAVVPNLRQQQVVATFQQFFYWLAYSMALFFIYTSGIRITQASNSSIQRDRIKHEFVGLIIAALFLEGGAHVATLVTQGSYDITSWMFAKSGDSAQTLIGNVYSPTVSQHTNAWNDLWYAMIMFFSAIMALVLDILYGFRAIFVDVWVAIFPFAMVSYAHEKTRGIFKMWWAEWIYQMLLPVGQSLIFSIGMGIVSTGATASQTSVDVGDILTSLAGVFGFFFAGSYIRKFVDTIAGEFKTSSLGVNTMGGMVGGAVGALVGDKAASLGLKVGAIPAKTVASHAFKAMDNSKIVRNMAQKSLKAHPEAHASAIAQGADFDDITAMHRTGGQGSNDTLANGDLLGIVGGNSVHGGGSLGDRMSGGGNRPTPRKRYGGHPLLHSRTADALRDLRDDTKQAMANSNMGMIWNQAKAGWQNSGMLAFTSDDKLQSKIEKGTLANRTRLATPLQRRYRQEQTLRQARTLLRDQADVNAASKYAVNASGQTFYPATEDNPTASWSGPTEAMAKYEKASTNLANGYSLYDRAKTAHAKGIPTVELEASTVPTSVLMQDTFEKYWSKGNDAPMYHEMLQAQSSPNNDIAQRAKTAIGYYQNAKANFAPAVRDMQARSMIDHGKINHLGTTSIDGEIRKPARPMSEQTKMQLRLEDFVRDYRAGTLRTSPYHTPSTAQIKDATPREIDHEALVGSEIN